MGLPRLIWSISQVVKAKAWERQSDTQETWCGVTFTGRMGRGNKHLLWLSPIQLPWYDRFSWHVCFFVGETHNTAGCPLLNWLVDYIAVANLCTRPKQRHILPLPRGTKIICTGLLDWTMPRPISKVRAAASAKWKSNTAPRSNATIAKKHKIPAARVGVACKVVKLWLGNV